MPLISYRNLFLSQHNFGLNYGRDVEVLHLVILQTIKVCGPSRVIVRNRQFFKLCLSYDKIHMPRSNIRNDEIIHIFFYVETSQDSFIG